MEKESKESKKETIARKLKNWTAILTTAHFRGEFEV